MLTVLADDLSGAQECAALALSHHDTTPWSAGGPHAALISPSVRTVLLDSRVNLDACGATTPVLAADLDTRALSAADASARTAKALERLGLIGSGFDSVLLKYDSLLRGPIADQLRTAAQFAPVLFCPAVPALGRTMCSGIVHVDGVPLHETKMWAAEQRRAPGSAKELFPDPHGGPSHCGERDGASALGGDIVEVSLAQLRSGRLSELLQQYWKPGRIVLCDGFTDSDLDGLVQAGKRAGYLFAGASGLAGALIRAAHAPAAATARHLGDCHGTLMVLGTASSAAREQVAHLNSLGVPIQAWRPGEDLKLDGNGPHVVIVDVPMNPSESPAIMRAMAAAVERAQSGQDLFLSGGQTARNVLDALGITTLHPFAHPFYGTVAALTDEGRIVVTRPGSFGAPDELEALLDALRTYRGHKERTRP